MEPTTQKPFRKTAREFMRRMIKRRKMMIRLDVSKKNLLSVGKDLEYLDLHLNHYKYHKDLDMALFVVTNQERIRNIIPALHKSAFEEFTEIIRTAKQIREENKCKSFSIPSR